MKKCVCGSYFCISSEPKYKCEMCHKYMCKIMKIDDNIDNKIYCIGCYFKSFVKAWNKTEKKEELLYNLDKKSVINTVLH